MTCRLGDNDSWSRGGGSRKLCEYGQHAGGTDEDALLMSEVSSHNNLQYLYDSLQEKYEEFGPLSCLVGFTDVCSQRLLRIRWLNKMSNSEWKNSKQKEMQREIICLNI